MKDLRSVFQIVPKYIVFVVTLSGTLGSLYFSEVQRLLPCDLCWYQRIMLYPLAIITLVGVMRRDAKFYVYTFPLAFIGAVVALYHYLLQKTNLFPKAVIGCNPDNPCNQIDFEVAGFITIPLLSFCAFLVILVCNYLMHKYGVRFEGKN